MWSTWCDFACLKVFLSKLLPLLGQFPEETGCRAGEVISAVAQRPCCRSARLDLPRSARSQRPVHGQLPSAARPGHLPKPQEACPRCRQLRVPHAISPRPTRTDLARPRAPEAPSFHLTPAQGPLHVRSPLSPKLGAKGANEVDARPSSAPRPLPFLQEPPGRARWMLLRWTVVEFE